MAKQTGVLKYSGNLGGISHYKMKGVQADLAKVANGPSKSQIANDPAFQRTRENNSEFGGSAKAGKALRVGLASVLKNFSDPQVTGRITKVFKAINANGSGVRGKRNIDLSLYPEQFNNFEFNKTISFSSLFNAPFEVKDDPSRDSSSIEVEPFNPLDSIIAPPGSTHFRLINGLAVVSDYRFNNISKAYEPVEPSLDKINNISFSNYLPVDQPISTPISIISNLNNSITSDVSVVNVIGIIFYQEVSGDYYSFSSGNAMKIAKIF